MISANEEPATRELARQLGLKAGAPLIRIETLRFADRTPICTGTNWLSAERFADAGRIYERMRSMTKVLAHYDIRDYRRASTRVRAAIVDATDAARLDLALGRLHRFFASLGGGGIVHRVEQGDQAAGDDADRRRAN